MSLNINRESIKKHLKRTDLKNIAKQFGFTQSYISQVLRGERSNLELLNAIIEKAEENKSKAELLEIRTQKL